LRRRRAMDGRGAFLINGAGPSPRWTCHVGKTGLVLANGPGVNGFASLRGQIPSFVVDGPIWHNRASSRAYSAFYSYIWESDSVSR
jgi:hypothetical protein